MSDPMFRLAHISDIHLGPLPRITLRELASKRITGYVNWQRNRRKRLFGNILESLLEEIKSTAPDHLAITGDLVNLAANAEIEVATAWLKAVGDPLSVSYVPGNHDAYVPGAYKKIYQAWRPNMLGDDHQHRQVDDSHFPYLRVRDQMALIGVSTAYATPPLLASGLFGRRQARELGQLLDETRKAGLFRTIMIHHPPVRGAAASHKRLLGIGRFARVMQDHGAELILHGHTHLDTLYHLDGLHGSIPVVGVPSASEGPGGSKPASGYNLLTIDGEQDKWQCQLERFGLGQNGRTFDRVKSENLMQ